MRSFMCALYHDQSANFVSYLEKYIDPISPYVIGLETSKDTHQDTSGQHYHICCNMTDKQYDSFRNAILVKHYGLRGQARDGKPRQYGSVRNIRDATKMLQYTVKDQNIIYKNFPLEKIQELIQASYHRPEKRDLHKEVTNFLMSHDHMIHQDLQDLAHEPVMYGECETLAITYLIQFTDKTPTKSLIQSLVRSYLTHCARLYQTRQSIDELTYYLRI